MLVVRQGQLAVFEEPLLQQFETAMLARTQRYFPMDAALLGEAHLRAAIRQAARKAFALGFTEQSQVCRYFDLSLCLGTAFPSDPLLPWGEACLTGTRGESGAFEQLFDAAVSYIEAVSGEDGEYATRAIVRARALSFAEAANPNADHGPSTLRILRKLWPQKFRRSSGDDQARFLALAGQLSRRDDLDAPGPRQLYTILMFLLGSHFARDATIPWAREALIATTGASPEKRARTLYDAGMGFIDAFRALLPSKAPN